jgi:DNA polymerase III subunit beta
MNLLISSTNLANAARIAARAVRHQKDRKFPILNCCRITAGSNLSIYGTDLDTGIAAKVECDVLDPGEAAVDAQKLGDIAAKLRGDVCISRSASDLVIKCGRSRFTLPIQSLDDAPLPLAIEEGAAPIALIAADVMALFAGAAAGSATNDARIYLSGPALLSEDNRLCAVGADSLMLSYAATIAACPDLGAGAIVHRDTCKLAVDLFGKTGASLKLCNNLVELSSDSARLAAKLVDAVPSAWRSMVPRVEMTNTAIVARVDLVGTLERCFAVVNHLTGDLAKKAPSITLWWDDSICEEVRVAYGDIRTAPACRDAIPTKVQTGKVSISINPKHLLRLLEGLGGEDICLSASDRSTPLRIDAGSDRFVVLSPMRDFPHISEKTADDFYNDEIGF